ncbi:MAG TPA: SDR family oxidoreductase [Myxococcota bacterium]|nr:SDR family oxidoreductase [Myxococcota bacterium]
MSRYAGKVAIVTGASGGIGRATAKRLAAEGASVLLTDLAGSRLEDAAHDAKGAARVETLAVDVSREDHVKRMIETAEQRFGGLDLLVNNAGIEGAVCAIEEYPVDTFDQVLAVNVRGVFLGVKHAAPALRRRGGGAIVNIASVAGQMGDPNIIAYIASKHAVIGITRSAAIGLGPHGIRVNAVCPSPVETRMMRALEVGLAGNTASAEIVKKAMTERIPLGRYAEPDEIAALIAFLGSDEARFINGSQYTIHGGMNPF